MLTRKLPLGDFLLDSKLPVILERYIFSFRNEQEKQHIQSHNKSGIGMAFSLDCYAKNEQFRILENARAL